MSHDPFLDTARRALAASDDEVGPACMNVEVPPTVVMDDDFREAYVQGYRHALSDARRVLREREPHRSLVTTRAEAEALYQRAVEYVDSLGDEHQASAKSRVQSQQEDAS